MHAIPTALSIPIGMWYVVCSRTQTVNKNELVSWWYILNRGRVYFMYTVCLLCVPNSGIIFGLVIKIKKYYNIILQWKAILRYFLEMFAIFEVFESRTY